MPQAHRHAAPSRYATARPFFLPLPAQFISSVHNLTYVEITNVTYYVAGGTFNEYLRHIVVHSKVLNISYTSASEHSVCLQPRTQPRNSHAGARGGGDGDGGLGEAQHACR